jgi:hypothetical protein
MDNTRDRYVPYTIAVASVLAGLIRGPTKTKPTKLMKTIVKPIGIGACNNVKIMSYASHQHPLYQFCDVLMRIELCSKNDHDKEASKCCD